MRKIQAILTLLRPANIVTSVADILGAYFFSLCFGLYEFDIQTLVFLCLATIGLYGGGIILNDFFDYKIDQIERPERPIPRGSVTLLEAGIIGFSLLICGVFFGFLVGIESGIVALVISVLVLIYNKWAKHNVLLGPLIMGMCRAGNFVLGMLMLPFLKPEFFSLAVIPLFYIASITLISRGEVHGGNKFHIRLGGLFYAIVMYCIGYSIIYFGKGNIAISVGFLLFFGYWIFKPYLVAYKSAKFQNIRAAVKAGVIGIIILDSVWASMYQWQLGFLVLLLLPLSKYFAQKYTVT